MLIFFLYNSNGEYLSNAYIAKGPIYGTTKIFFLISKNCIYQKPIRGRNQIHKGCTTKNKGHNLAYKRERLDTKGTPKLTRSSPNKPPSSKKP
jgi:hypothetical protein